MSFRWGGITWESNQLQQFVTYLNSQGVDYDTWASNHPTAAASFYDPNAYVPGGSSPAVSQAIQDAGYANEGNNPPNEIQADIADQNPVPAPPPEDNVGGGYDAAKAAAAAGRQATGQPGTPDYPAPGTGGFGQAPAIDPTTPSGAPNTGSGAAGQAGLAELIDWSQILGMYGLPADLIAQINHIFAVTGGNLQQAIPIAQATVRGSDWYRATFPGIQEGINAGLFTDESGYRAYQNQVNQIFQQYYGRMATTAEASNYMRTGKSIQQVASVFQAEASRGTISDPLKALFTDDEITALVNEQSGIDSMLGQVISQKADMAMKVTQLYTDFYGRAMTRSELDDIVRNGLTPEAVSRQLATTANINAMNPAIRDLFSQQEIQQMALTAAGGVTEFGDLLQQKAALAAQLNSIYHTFSGSGVSREEVENAWSQGLTAQEVNNRMQASALANSVPSFLRDIFTQDQLQLAAGATAGSNLSAEALAAQRIVNAAPDYQTVIRQYENRNITSDEVQGFVNEGTSAQLLGQQYQARGIAVAQGEDFNRVLGSFGEDHNTIDQSGLKALSEQQAGIDTILGRSLQKKLEQAQQRLAGAFQGTIAKPSLSIVGGKLTTGLNKPSDTGA